MMYMTNARSYGRSAPDCPLPAGLDRPESSTSAPHY